MNIFKFCVYILYCVSFVCYLARLSIPFKPYISSEFGSSYYIHIDNAVMNINLIDIYEIHVSYNGKIRESKLLQYLQIQRKWEVNHIVHLVITSFLGRIISTSSDYFPKCCIIDLFFKEKKTKMHFSIKFYLTKNFFVHPKSI